MTLTVLICVIKSKHVRQQKPLITLNIIIALCCCLISVSKNHPSSHRISVEGFEYGEPVITQVA